MVFLKIHSFIAFLNKSEAI